MAEEKSPQTKPILKEKLTKPINPIKSPEQIIRSKIKAPKQEPKAVPTKPEPSPSPPKPEPPKKHTVQNNKLIASLLYMKENSLMQESKANPHFDSIKEAEDYSKEEITSSIKDSVNRIKEDISDLQKRGINLHLDGIKLLEIPLKVRVWESNCLKGDLEAIYSIINVVKSKTDKLIKEAELEDSKKEAEEKLKEAEELKPKPEDPNKIKPIPKFIKKEIEEELPKKKKTILPKTSIKKSDLPSKKALQK